MTKVKDKKTASADDVQKPWQFQPGQSGNPAGRQPGSKNELNEEVVSATLKDFKEHGAAAIIECRESNPGLYFRTVVSMLPKDLNVNHNLDDEIRELKEGELIELLSSLRANNEARIRAGEAETTH